MGCGHHTVYSRFISLKGTDDPMATRRWLWEDRSETVQHGDASVVRSRWMAARQYPESDAHTDIVSKY